MNLVHIAQSLSAIAGIILILAGSRILKKELRVIARF